MDDKNIYASPEADVDVADPAQYELASRWARLFGALLDGIIVGMAFVPFLFLIGYYDSFGDPGAAALPTMTAFVTPAVGYVVLYIVFNGYLLHTSGQSIGKRVLGTRIVSVQTGKILPLSRVIFLRFLPFTLAAYVPLIGPIIGLANNLAIFTSSKRCLHDYIAGTKVVKA